MKKQRNPKKTNLILLEIFSFLITITPLLIVVICNWSHYFKTTGDTIKFCIGGFIVLFLLFLKAIGKLKMPERKVVTYGIWFALCYLLSAVVNDCVLLVGMAWLGELLDYMFFQYPIKKLRKEILIGETADATADKINKILDERLGGK